MALKNDKSELPSLEKLMSKEWTGKEALNTY